MLIMKIVRLSYLFRKAFLPLMSTSHALAAIFSLTSIGGSKEEGAVQFLSFSCNFRHKYCQIIAFVSNSGAGTQPVWKILDPPLTSPLFES